MRGRGFDRTIFARALNPGSSDRRAARSSARSGILHRHPVGAGRPPYSGARGRPRAANRKAHCRRPLGPSDACNHRGRATSSETPSGPQTGARFCTDSATPPSSPGRSRPERNASSWMFPRKGCWEEESLRHSLFLRTAARSLSESCAPISGEPGTPAVSILRVQRFCGSGQGPVLGRADRGNRIPGLEPGQSIRALHSIRSERAPETHALAHRCRWRRTSFHGAPDGRPPGGPRALATAGS